MDTPVRFLAVLAVAQLAFALYHISQAQPISEVLPKIVPTYAIYFAAIFVLEHFRRGSFATLMKALRDKGSD